MNEHWYRDVVEMSRDAIYVWCDGCFVYANRAAARLFGFDTPESMIGRRVFDLIHPESLAIARARMQRLLFRQEQLAPQEMKFVRTDGQVIEVEAMATRFEHDGRPAAHVMLRDLSERKALQRDHLRQVHKEAEHRRLQAERDYFFQLFDTTPHMAWTARPDGYLDNVNQRARDYLSSRGPEIEGWNWQQFVHPDDLRELLRRWAHSLETGTAYEGELRMRANATGVYRWHLSRALPVRNSKGEILRWVGTTTDIHDQKEARAVLEQSQIQLAEAVRLRTQDLSNANAALRFEIEERMSVERALRTSREKLRRLSAHLQSTRESERAAVAREIHDELGATLTAAKMDLHWFARTLDDGNVRKDKLAESVALIDSAIESVRRIATGLRPSILDHLGLWAALQWQLHEFELNFGIPCQIDPAPEGIVLENDAQTAVFRIFQEALTNIARHAQATQVHIGLQLDVSAIVVRISDNGVGISPEKIMEPEACGIQGMRERARNFGGNVKFERPERGGTTVLVKFPARFKVAKRARRDREAVAK